MVFSNLSNRYDKFSPFSVAIDKDVYNGRRQYRLYSADTILEADSNGHSADTMMEGDGTTCMTQRYNEKRRFFFFLYTVDILYKTNTNLIRILHIYIYIQKNFLFNY